MMMCLPPSCSSILSLPLLPSLPLSHTHTSTPSYIFQRVYASVFLHLSFSLSLSFSPFSRCLDKREADAFTLSLSRFSILLLALSPARFNPPTRPPPVPPRHSSPTSLYEPRNTARTSRTVPLPLNSIPRNLRALFFAPTVKFLGDILIGNRWKIERGARGREEGIVVSREMICDSTR